MTTHRSARSPWRETARRTLAVTASLVLLSLPGPARAEKFKLEGDKLAIYNLAGECRIESGGGSAVEIEVDLKGKDAKLLKVETGPVKGRAALRVLYPGDQFLYPRMGSGSQTNVKLNKDGSFGGNMDFGARKVTIRGRGAGLEAWADIVVKVPKGRDVALHLGVGEISANGVEGTLALDTASGPVRAGRHRGTLSVDTGSGDVTVDDAEGDVRIDTGSGSVTLTGIHSASLDVDTGSGTVQGSRLRAARLTVDTGSGSIQLESVQSAVIKLDTGSGGVSLALDSDIEDVLIDTGSGSVTVRVPRALGAMLSAETGSGGIDVDAEATEIRKGGGELTARLGDGGGKLRIDTGAGSVRVVQR